MGTGKSKPSVEAVQGPRTGRGEERERAQEPALDPGSRDLRYMHAYSVDHGTSIECNGTLRVLHSNPP
jgi:hypothetical protein